MLSHGKGRPILGTSGNDTLQGSNGCDTLFGFAGDDLIDAGLGDDRVFAGSGRDTVFGGNGNDRLDGGSGADDLQGGAGRDLLVGGSGNDRLNGGVGNDRELGGAGDDIFETDEIGDDGDDWMEGGSGNDEFWQFGEFGSGLKVPGNDSMFGGAGHDMLDFSRESVSSTPAVVVDLQQGTWHTADNAGVIRSIEAIRASWYDDRLLGSRASEGLFGDAGNDYIDGRAGNDTVMGDAGTDTLYGGAGNDRVVADFPLGEGTGGDDVLQGGPGNDTLEPGDGHDTVVGGLGADDFLFGFAGRPPGEVNRSVISDFTSGSDELVFENSIFWYSAIGPAGDWSRCDERFYAAPGASSGHDSSDRLVYDTEVGHLYYDADGSGAEAPLVVATLTGAPLLKASDIEVI